MKSLSHNTQFLFLCLLAILLVFNPFYLHQEINLFEWGLYLPGIDGVLHGQVPYRDFFHLRGPLEIYFPALWMKIFGEQAAVLATYFYVGTVLTLVLSLLIAKEVLETRMLWILAPVLVARTFPRVVFTFWGGFRYVWGLIAVYCAIRFLKVRKLGWVLAAGILTMIAAFTSPEIGLSALVAIVAALTLEAVVSKNMTSLFKTVGAFAAGTISIVLPVLLYFYFQGALGMMIEMITQVASSMTKVFIIKNLHSTNPYEWLTALVNPHHPNFRHLTPLYCYLFFFIYVIRQIARKQMGWMDWAVSIAAVYGLMIYMTGFRNIESSIFEMSLQPEKIVLFFLISKGFLFLKEKGFKKSAYLLMAVVVASSLVFSLSHMARRFFIFQYLSHKYKSNVINDQPAVKLDLPRMKSIIVSQKQAEDFKGLKSFFDTHTKADEYVPMFAELGTLNFLIERPYVGRFANISLSWLKDSWHQEVMQDIKNKKTRYVVINKTFPPHFESTYFLVKSNKQKFDEFLSYIRSNYVIVSQTPSYNIYQRLQKGN
jgi:hypothetical protein